MILATTKKETNIKETEKKTREAIAVNFKAAKKGNSPWNSHRIRL